MLVELASDILLSPEMQREQNFIQHGSTTCYAHSANVACMALYLADVLHLRVDRLSLARGALLHDFSLRLARVTRPTGCTASAILFCAEKRPQTLRPQPHRCDAIRKHIPAHALPAPL